MKTITSLTAGSKQARRQHNLRLSVARFPGRCLVAAALALSAWAAELQASDPIGIYAFVDKVVFEPGSGPAERIQVWGGFVLAEGRGERYAAAKRGFLYMEANKADAVVTRNEWNDLKSVAGTGQIVSFGSRYKALPTVRDPKAELKNPDPYPIGFGLTKVRAERSRDYQPLQQLRTLQEAKDKTSSLTPPVKAASPTKAQE